jgi:polysaccharide biosynthesis transport protein
VDLREFFSVLSKWRVLVAVVVVFSGALGAAFAAQRPATYESTATIAITPNIGSLGLVSADALSALLGTYAETAESDTNRRSAQDILGHPLDGTVNATTEEGTGVLRISVRAHNAAKARDSASAVAEAFQRRLAGNPNIAVDLVSPASVPSTPVQPRPPLIIATSLFVGFGVAILLAIALDRLRRRITTAEDLGEISPLPLLGQVKRNRRLLRTGPQIVWEDERLTEIQENFRSLRTNIQLGMDEESLALQITSAGSAQGKSTIAANLGIAFADIGVKTVVVDADLRRPAQGDIFNVGALDSSWAGPRRAGNPAKTSFPNLSVLTAGTPRSDPTELLQFRFPDTITQLRNSWELILIDTPPLLPVSDARVISRWVDDVMIIIASGEERPNGLSRAIDQLELAKAKLNGFVMNKVASTGEGSYYRPPETVPRSTEPKSEKEPAVVASGRKRRVIRARSR